MHPNAQLLTDFYDAFSRRDGAAMASAYADDVRFSDPVFTDLRGDRAGAMWQMLCERGTDLVVEASGIEADDRQGRAHWEATYTFSTGRTVHNVIDAEFTFADGKIATHTDRFDLWKWSRQALGPMGLALGWTPIVQNQIRSQASKGLDTWIAKQS